MCENDSGQQMDLSHEKLVSLGIVSDEEDSEIFVQYDVPCIEGLIRPIML